MVSYLCLRDTTLLFHFICSRYLTAFHGASVLERGESLESSVSYTHLLYDQMIADVVKVLTKYKYTFFYK